MTINGRRPHPLLASLPARADGGHLFGVWMMEEAERTALIDQLDRSFTALPNWAKAALTGDLFGDSET